MHSNANYYCLEVTTWAESPRLKCFPNVIDDTDVVTVKFVLVTCTSITLSVLSIQPAVYDV